MFSICNNENCTEIAEFSCLCRLLCCRTHLIDHMVSYRDHHPSSILLELTDNEISVIQTSQKYLYSDLVFPEILSRNRKVEEFLVKIKQVEEESSRKIEKQIKKLAYFKGALEEARYRRTLPLVSNNSFASSLAFMKHENRFSLETIRETIQGWIEYSTVPTAISFGSKSCVGSFAVSLDERLIASSNNWDVSLWDCLLYTSPSPRDS